MLTPPLSLELGRGEIAQRGVDTLVHVNVIHSASFGNRENLPNPLIASSIT